MLSNFTITRTGLKAVQRYDLYLYLQNLVCMNFQFHRHETEIPSAWNGSFIGME